MDANPPVETPAAPPPAPLTPAEERSWAMLAHLSVLLNLMTGFLGIVAPLIIYLAYRERSRYVAYQSLQSLIFQLVVWGGGGVAIAIVWAITGILSALLIGLLCIPFALLFSLVPLAAFPYGIYAAIKCNQGEDFQYWQVGAWLRGTLTGA